MPRILAILMLVLISIEVSPAYSGDPTSADDVEVTKALGGSIRTDLGYGIVLNKDSTLQREWIAVKHGMLPVKLRGTPGIRTVYESGPGYSGNYVYSADFKLEVSEPIMAIEIRFLTFDVWGEHDQSLSMTEIKDFDVGTYELDGKWNLFSENRASEFYASIAYVARVRTKSGKVLKAEVKPVIDEARKFSSRFSETDLEPKKPAK